MIPSRLERSAPRRVVEQPLHKFSVGDRATWRAQPVAQARSRGVVTVVSLLPPLGDVVLEHELSPETATNLETQTFA